MRPRSTARATVSAQVREDPEGNPGDRPPAHHRRHFAAGQQRQPSQRGGGLRHLRGLRKARQGRARLRRRSWARCAAGSPPYRMRSCSRSCRRPSRGWASPGGFQMMLQLKGAGFDFAKIGQMTDEMVRDGNTQSGLIGLNTSFRPGYPHGRHRRGPGQGRERQRTRSAASSARSRPTSDPTTSTSSTSSAAPTRSTSRPTAATASSPTTSAGSTCATPRARWSRSGP